MDCHFFKMTTVTFTKKEVVLSIVLTTNRAASLSEILDYLLKNPFPRRNSFICIRAGCANRSAIITDQGVSLAP